MSNYTKSTNFATKDNLVSGDPLKIVKGTEIDTEYNNIATAIATKTDNASAAITGGTITGITDLAVADGGTGASTAAGALNNLLPSQTSAANKYLQSDGTNASWDAISINTGDITGTLAVANGGTGVTSSTGTGSTVLSNSPTLVTPTLGTPASATLTNATGLPISTGVSGLGTGVATALAVNTGSTGAPVLFNGALGTPSSGTVTNLTGTASININGTVGAVGPASGSFTTLNTSSTVTISGGTANGIGYLNASKVFTTGTVLKFDGTNITSDRSSGTAYSGTSFATWANGIVLNNSATPATGLLNSLYFTNNANMQNVFGVVQNASGYGDFVWAGYSGSYAEAMRLTSGGLAVTGTLSASSTATLNTLASSGATLTGGTINGMTIGATTASTGAFTTTTVSTSETLSYGTANGVTYLNGSKVLTSGSALVFNGADLGVGVASPTSRLDVGVSSATAYSSGVTGNGLRLYNSSASNGQYVGITFQGEPTSGNAGIATILGTTTSSGNMDLVFSTRGSSVLAEGMRLTSTGLGIGTSSPAVKLDVVDNSSNAQGQIRLSSSSGYGTRQTFVNTATNGRTFQIGCNFAVGQGEFSILDSTAGVERLQINASGNMGLGVTPSAWSFKAFEFGYAGNALWASATNDVRLTANVNYNSGYKYTNTSTATMYAQGGGQHAWFNAPSGTAGNAITFTQAMTLDASGNLGVGTTSPSSVSRLVSVPSNTTGSSVYTAIGASNYVDSDFQIYISGSASTDKRAVIGPSTSTALAFTSGGTERARIDSSGRFLVGVTSPVGSTFSTIEYSGGYNGLGLNVSTNTSGARFMLFASVGTQCGVIDRVGTTSAVVYTATSDRRLKENIVDAPSAIEHINAVKVRSYNWIDGGHQVKYGVIAQEFIDVEPDAVVQGDAGKTIEKTWSVDTSALVPAMIKAIQEQQAMIELLKARLDAANL